MSDYDDPYESPILKRLRFWKHQNVMREMWEREMEWRNKAIEAKIAAAGQAKILWGTFNG